MNNKIIIYQCPTCKAPRKDNICWKCHTETFLPHPSWEYPKLPDIEPMKVLAKTVGYNLVVHGSMERDLDILLIPWTTEAIDAKPLIDLLVKELNLNKISELENKPFGRVAISLTFNGWFKHLDVSITPKY